MSALACALSSETWQHACWQKRIRVPARISCHLCKVLRILYAGLQQHWGPRPSSLCWHGLCPWWLSAGGMPGPHAAVSEGRDTPGSGELGIARRLDQQEMEQLMSEVGQE